MLIGAALIAGMLIWSRGRTALMEQYSSRYPTFEAAKPMIARSCASAFPARPFFWLPAPTTFRRSSCTTSSAAARSMKRSSC